MYLLQALPSAQSALQELILTLPVCGQLAEGRVWSREHLHQSLVGKIGMFLKGRTAVKYFGPHRLCASIGCYMYSMLSNTA